MPTRPNFSPSTPTCHHFVKKNMRRFSFFIKIVYKSRPANYIQNIVKRINIYTKLYNHIKHICKILGGRASRARRRLFFCIYFYIRVYCCMYFYIFWNISHIVCYTIVIQLIRLQFVTVYTTSHMFIRVTTCLETASAKEIADSSRVQRVQTALQVIRRVLPFAGLVCGKRWKKQIVTWGMGN